MQQTKRNRFVGKQNESDWAHTKTYPQTNIINIRKYKRVRDLEVTKNFELKKKERKDFTNINLL